MVNFKRLEKIVKGGANHWRLRILFLLEDEGGVSLMDIAKRLGGHFKTISEHTKKLSEGGLIEKRYRDRTVFHSLSALGAQFLGYLKKLI